MRRCLVSKAAAGVGALLLGVAVAPASDVFAKGFESVTLEGPGIARPIEVVSERGELAGFTAVWEMTPGHPEPVTVLRRAPTTRLGPSYVVIWHVLTGVEQTTPFRQELYPHAEDGPLVHTPAGQVIFGDVTGGGWYQAPDALRSLLLRLGVPPLDALAKPAVLAAAGVESGYPWSALAGLAAATLVLVAAAVVSWRVHRARTHKRMAAIPL